MNAEDFYQQGLKKAESHNLKGAIEDFTEVLRLNPNFADAYYNRALAYDRRSSKKPQKAIEFKQQALEDYAQALRLAPDKIRAYVRRARLHEQLGDLSGAFEDLTQALRLDPESAPLYIHQGHIRDNLGDFSGALENFTQALQFSSGGDYDASIYYRRGDVHLKMGDFQSAIEDFNQLLQIPGGHIEAYYWRGKARAELGDVTGAIQDYTDAIRNGCAERSYGYESDIAPIYVCRGLLYLYIGNKKGAIADLQEAAELYRQELGLYPGGIPTEQRLLAYIKELQH